MFRDYWQILVVFTAVDCFFFSFLPQTLYFKGSMSSQVRYWLAAKVGGAMYTGACINRSATWIFSQSFWVLCYMILSFIFWAIRYNCCFLVNILLLQCYRGYRGCILTQCLFQLCFEEFNTPSKWIFPRQWELWVITMPDSSLFD